MLQRNTYFRVENDKDDLIGGLKLNVRMYQTLVGRLNYFIQNLQNSESSLRNALSLPRQQWCRVELRKWSDEIEALQRKVKELTDALTSPKHETEWFNTKIEELNGKLQASEAEILALQGAQNFYRFMEEAQPEELRRMQRELDTLRTRMTWQQANERKYQQEIARQAERIQYLERQNQMLIQDNNNLRYQSIHASQISSYSLFVTVPTFQENPQSQVSAIPVQRI